MRKIRSSGNTCVKCAVQFFRRREITSERLLDDDASAVGEPDLLQGLHHLRKMRRRNGEVEHR